MIIELATGTVAQWVGVPGDGWLCSYCGFNITQINELQAHAAELLTGGGRENSMDTCIQTCTLGCGGGWVGGWVQVTVCDGAYMYIQVTHACIKPCMHASEME